MLKNAIQKLMRHENLDAVTCQEALNALLSDDNNIEQSTAFLVLLRSKRETSDELQGLISSLQQQMIKVPMPQPVMDIVGTGGDSANTINISTGSALLAAASGVKIAKHGNRAVSSQCGSADVLEALGIEINVTPEKIYRCVDEVGFAFLYAPNFHPQISRLRSLRTNLAIPTSLNMLGPLVNPASPQTLLLGISDRNLFPIYSQQIQKMGMKRAVIAHSLGLDEISCAGETSLRFISAQGVTDELITPEQFSLSRCSINDLRGGNSSHNAALLRKVFHGIRSRQLDAIANTLILNTAIALYLDEKCTTINDGIEHASDILYRGDVVRLLRHLVECTHD